ncbi:MAG: FAD-dependent oxidoreductase [Lachnospiraceae bacterium]|nr:FAD-dependent oxidoreductase [Lachnospiraceae bacterium]
MHIYDLVIIGSGPAGMAAAIYAARAELDFLVIERSPIAGGQVQQTYEVDNYPGLPGLSGPELSEQMRKHCDRLGVKFMTEEVRSLTRILPESDNGTGTSDKASPDISGNNSPNPESGVYPDSEIFLIKTWDKNEYAAKCVIAASGAHHSTLGIPGEEELAGAGVSYCATCDGAFFKNKVCAVVGGGDVAVEDAIYLSKLCTKVYLIHRRDEFRAAAKLVSEARSRDNIEFVTSCTPERIEGSGNVEKLIINDKKTGQERELAVNGVFIAVGIKPENELFADLADTDDKGYVIAGEDCVTSCPGLFAAGDLRGKPLRQIVTAAADGANAVTSVLKHLGA